MFPCYPGCVWIGELFCLSVAILCCHLDNQFTFYKPNWEAKITKTSQTHVYLAHVYLTHVLLQNLARFLKGEYTQVYLASAMTLFSMLLCPA